MIESARSDIRSALRQRALSVVKATTGTLTNVSVSGSTYTRAAGSFITDGFGQGDEVYAAGFAASNNNGRSLISSVAALTMTVDRALTTASAGASVSIVAGLPQGRAWELEPYSPVTKQPFVEELLTILNAPVVGISGSTKRVRHDALYILTLVYPIGKGPLAIERMAGALVKHFKPGTALSYGAIQLGIDKAESTRIVRDDTWGRLPVQIRLHCDTDD